MLHTTYFQRPNGDDEDIELMIEFTLSGGSPETRSSMFDPGEPAAAPDFCVEGAYLPDGSWTVLSDGEYAQVQADVFDRLGDFAGDDEYEDL